MLLLCGQLELLIQQTNKYCQSPISRNEHVIGYHVFLVLLNTLSFLLLYISEYVKTAIRLNLYFGTEISEIIINGLIDLLICASICNTMYNNGQVRIITTGPVVEFKFIGDTDFSVSSGDSDNDDCDAHFSI